MQWDDTARAGFTHGTPWLPLGSTHQSDNVAVMARDPKSILSLYRRLIERRREHPALSIGALTDIKVIGNVLVYQRREGSDHLAVLLNMAHDACAVPRPNPAVRASVLLSTIFDKPDEAPIGPDIALRPDEGLVLAFHPPAGED